MDTLTQQKINKWEHRFQDILNDIKRASIVNSLLFKILDAAEDWELMEPNFWFEGGKISLNEEEFELLLSMTKIVKHVQKRRKEKSED